MYFNQPVIYIEKDSQNSNTVRVFHSLSQIAVLLVKMDQVKF